MGKIKKISILIVAAFFVLGHVTLKVWTQDVVECDETRETFTENFDEVIFKNEDASSVDHWCEECGCGGYVTLSYAGIFHQIPFAADISSWINRVCYANFDLDPDGLVDFIASSDQYYRRIAFVRNNGDGSFTENTPYIRDGSSPGSRQNCFLAGDFNDDGYPDFMYVQSNAGASASPDSLTDVWFFEHEGWVDSNGIPQFTIHDYTSELIGILEGIGWNVTNQAVDFDGDGDLDILFANGYGKVILLKNNSDLPLSNTSKFVGSILIDARDGEPGRRWDERGVIAVGCGDFNGDDYMDIVIGAVNWRGIKHYENDGSNHFVLKDVIGDMSGSDLNDDLYDGACSALAVADYDKDGDLDFLVATDNWNRQEAFPPVYEDTGMGAKVFYFPNDGGYFESKLIYNQGIGVDDGGAEDPWDFDFGLPLDYDGDGDIDFMVADGNHSEFYYIFENLLSDRYNLAGEAVSTNITEEDYPGGLDRTQHAVTRVRFTELDQTVLGDSDGLRVTYYVSNNGGRNWEFYAEFIEGDIQSIPSALPWHTFSTYGTDLRWKAELEAPNDYPDPEDEYYGTSDDTPRIDLIKIRYAFVDRLEYSRTSVAARVVDDDDQARELIIAGTFYYPGWDGHLRAYDVSGVAPGTSSYSELSEITSPGIEDPTVRILAPGVTLLWDAAELLADRSSISRTIYTALPDGNGGLERIEFVASNEALMRDAEDASILGDYNSDNEGLINFVRGEDPDRDWKLGDINHSNPVVVGPPEGIEAQMGSGYDTFKEEWADRAKYLIVGANDGMLHCFDLLTGVELWAFIPYSLLPSLYKMWPRDPITYERYFLRNAYVDGSPVYADVYIEDEWKTVILCGLGPGKGSTIQGGTTGNFYFALDITDIDNPIPLWEFTDDQMGETWSVPAIGRISKEGESTWTAFMGSGYDNVEGGRDGHRFYAVDIATGESFWSFLANPEINTRTGTPDGIIWTNGRNIPRAIPGSPAILDIGNTGDADRVYVGDLEGRIWKVNVSLDYLDADPWTAEVIYEDSNNYPIITKPAIWMEPGAGNAFPRLYFGTGGDERAPNDVVYSFIALIDDENTAAQADRVEWFLGDPGVLGIPSAKQLADLNVGEKVWADPQIANSIVYFSTLEGSIESVDPCDNLLGQGRLYARYTQSWGGTPIGGSAFKDAGGSMENMPLSIKTRAAVTLGETGVAGGIRKREVYIQQYDSTIMKLEQPIAPLLKIRSWREIYKIKR